MVVRTSAFAYRGMLRSRYSRVGFYAHGSASQQGRGVPALDRTLELAFRAAGRACSGQRALRCWNTDTIKGWLTTTPGPGLAGASVGIGWPPALLLTLAMPPTHAVRHILVITGGAACYCSGRDVEPGRGIESDALNDVKGHQGAGQRLIRC